jgi:hypothetical protein
VGVSAYDSRWTRRSIFVLVLVLVLDFEISSQRVLACRDWFPPNVIGSSVFERALGSGQPLQVEHEDEHEHEIWDETMKRCPHDLRTCRTRSLDEHLRYAYEGLRRFPIAGVRAPAPPKRTIGWPLPC